eukprot:CAMPEP_0179272060 /NCGR_PEP_ID=MMETSP0797-20121207/32300_1 /TAXON_ID=47934 /ORGANISM="Dinophysis acuminata, Strain DAEP01" /LENGTH=47 /DNA_ID= /DNA_START= /DNA_END= /DNA_ORIENTATION=
MCHNQRIGGVSAVTRNASGLAVRAPARSARQRLGSVGAEDDAHEEGA